MNSSIKWLTTLGILMALIGSHVTQPTTPPASSVTPSPSTTSTPAPSSSTAAPGSDVTSKITSAPAAQSTSSISTSSAASPKTASPTSAPVSSTGGGKGSSDSSASSSSSTSSSGSGSTSSSSSGSSSSSSSGSGSTSSSGGSSVSSSIASGSSTVSSTTAVLDECYNFTCSADQCLTDIVKNHKPQVKTCLRDNKYCMIKKTEKNATITFEASCSEKNCDYHVFNSEANGRVTTSCCNKPHCNLEDALNGGTLRLKGLFVLIVAAFAIRGALV